MKTAEQIKAMIKAREEELADLKKKYIFWRTGSDLYYVDLKIRNEIKLLEDILK